MNKSDFIKFISPLTTLLIFLVLSGTLLRTFWPQPEIAIQDLSFPPKLNTMKYTIKKPIDTYRIAVLGEPLLQGSSVPESASFCNILEALLNTHSQNKIEVLNFAKAGAGTIDEYIIFKDLLLRYQPDMLLLGFFVGNDVYDNSFGLEYRRSKHLLYFKEGKLYQLPFPSDVVALPWQLKFLNLVQKSHLTRLTLGNLYKKKLRYDLLKRGGEIPINYYSFLAEYPPAWERAWEITFTLLFKIKELTTISNINFALIIIPDRLQIYEDWWQEALNNYPKLKKTKIYLEHPTLRLIQFCEKNSIRYIDLTENFKKNSNKSDERLYLYPDGHFNSKGHLQTATIVADSIKNQQGLHAYYNK